MTPIRQDRDLQPLIVVSLLMAALTVVFATAMLVDPRTIEGVPAWLKPTKFAVSTAIYGGTLAWVLGALAGWPRLRRWAVWMTAVVFVGEVALIAMQAWRGTTSHFNTSTLFDGVVFAAMGLGIFAQTVVAGAVAVALWRQQFADRAAGWALRLGMTITIVGALTGGLMTRPTAEQIAAARLTGDMPRSGAHTVGALDGGPGLPGTGWSVTHGDLRVPHFVGLHAIQALPLLVWFTGRRRGDAARVRVVFGAAASYLGLYVILLAQALAGQSATAPRGVFLGALALWAVATIGFVAFAWFEPRAGRRLTSAWSLQ
jgi:hypothetical protein